MNVLTTIFSVGIAKWDDEPSIFFFLYCKVENCGDQSSYF